MAGVSCRSGPALDGASASAWVESALTELAGFDTVRLMRRTTIYGVYDQGTYGGVERVNDHVAMPPAHEPRQRGWRIVAKRAVLASGAIERGLAFANNDRPGVMLAYAARTYVNRFGVAPGKRAVILASCDDGWRTAETLAAAGIAIEAVVDTRQATLAHKHPWRVFPGGVVERARGGQRLHGVTVRDASGAAFELDCDLLAVANGWNPSLHLTCHLGGRPLWNDSISAFVPGALPPGMSVGGAAAGHFTLGELSPRARGSVPTRRVTLGSPRRCQRCPRWKTTKGHRTRRSGGFGAGRAPALSTCRTT